MFTITDGVPNWAPYSALGLATATLLVAAYWTGWRRARRKRPPASRNRTSRGDLAAAAIATVVSAEGMWESFGTMGVAVPLRIATFAFLEIAVVQSARRAKRAMQEPPFSAGVDGIAMWVFTGLSVLLSVAHEATATDPNLVVILIRLTAPPVAAWNWKRNMALEQRRHRRERRDNNRIHWRISLERVAVRFGLAEPTERTPGQVDEHRRITRLVGAAIRLRTYRRRRVLKWRRRLAARRLDRAMAEVLEHTDYARSQTLQEALMVELGAMVHTGGLADLNPPAPWTPAPPAARAGRTAICSGANSAPGVVAIRMREPGGRLRPVDLAPQGEESSPTTVSLIGRVREIRQARGSLRPGPAAKSGQHQTAHPGTSSSARTSIAKNAPGASSSALSRHLQVSADAGQDATAAEVDANVHVPAPGAELGAPSAASPRPDRPGDRKRPFKQRRSMQEWAVVAGPILERQTADLERTPTGDEFAAAISEEIGAPVSASTAKNIRAYLASNPPDPSASTPAGANTA
ncbi:hypothetical protein [Spirillospora sp. CA-294931]|uniref:hypothetical protein n=1 Tax=Spirillospora sp. CA-294931 TaxID=3240042 RepID=UPI003D8B1946